MSLSMIDRCLTVVGSGSFARSICHSLAVASTPIRVSVLARNDAAVEEIVRGCRARAGVSGAPVSFSGEVSGDLPETLGRLRPDILVCAASTQSPYERRTAPSAWTRLVERAGFGVTLPFQAAIVAGLARALAVASPETLLVNGCFPDAVNPLLAALGLPVHCGIGNVATLAACLQTTLELPDQDSLAVLGHHAQLSAPDPGMDEVLAWSAGRPVADVGSLLAAARALPRPELNAISGHAAARMLIELLAGNEIRTSLPGPLGLPGGYPVRLAGRSIGLNLPPGLDRAEAIAWNTRAGMRDGVEVSDGRVWHAPRVAAELARYLPELAEGWPVTALDDVGAAFDALRQWLRLAQPVQV
jgi:hypothetical protein